MHTLPTPAPAPTLPLALTRSQGAIVWQGPSPIDGAPLVAVATGLRRPSENRKTGPMVQVWILRADLAPSDAVESGADASVCGDCPLRGLGFKARACYVNVGQAPQSVWRAYKRGVYPVATPARAALRYQRSASFGP